MTQVLPPLVLPTFGNGAPANQGPPGPQGPAGADGATGPQGPAGPENPLAMSGDVDGYTNTNTVAALQGLPLSTSGVADGDVLTYSALGGTISFQPPSSVTLSGDVNGAPGSNVVTKLQGTNLLVNNFTDGAVLTYDVVHGRIALQSVGHVPMAGDVFGYTDNTQIGAIQGKDVNLSNTTDGNVLTWSSTDNRLELKTPASGSSGNVFVYRDAEPSPSGNVYSTWVDAYNAAIATGVPATIVIDDSISQAIIHPAADYDLHQITLMGASNIPYNTLISVSPNVTFNSGIYRITGGMIFQNTTATTSSIIPSSQTTFNFIVDDNSVVLNQIGRPMFDVSQMVNGSIVIVTDNGGEIISGGSGAEIIDFGTVNSPNASVYVGKQQSEVDQYLFVNGSGGAGIDMSIDAGAYTGTALSFPNYNNNSLSITFTTNSQFLSPFVSSDPLPTTNVSGGANITKGQMVYNNTHSKPFWFDGTNWNSYPDPYQPEYIYAISVGSIVNPSTGDNIVWNFYPAAYTRTYISTGGPGQIFINYLNPGPNVSFKITASLGGLFDGYIAYQLWDVQNNVGIGNTSTNLNGATPGIVTAILPSTYSANFTYVVLKLIYVNGTTNIGGGTAGGQIDPWIIVETIGSPQ